MWRAQATADAECLDCGYEPELKRTLGGIQVFAISFAFISVAVGIFASYDNLLGDRGAGRDLAVGHRIGRANAGGAGGRSVRGAHRTQRIVLSMGLAAGQPEDRMAVRVADLLVPGEGGGCDGQRTRQPGVHAAGRHAGERRHGPSDHGGDLDHSGGAGDCLDPPARHVQLRRGRARVGRS